LAGLITLSFKGAFFGFLWGGLVRMFILHHVTWCINSVCHMWGTRPHDTGDRSTNNFLLALVGFGEGNHNSHHAHQGSARHGLRWWNPDLSWYVIWCLGKLKLAWDIRRAT
jgi:stearoyl-CoA desaturase (delta-9 desaturase)